MTSEGLTLAREREELARLMLKMASENPAADPCDDAWMTAAIFQTLLDAERDLPKVIEPVLLARAIRFVERTRAHVQNEVFGGPEGRWYEGYAEDIATQYGLLESERA